MQCYHSKDILESNDILSEVMVIICTKIKCANL